MTDRATRKERNDIIATLVTASVVAIGVLATSIVRVLETFTPDGISVSIPFQGIPVELAPWDGLPMTLVRVTAGDVVATGVNAVSVFSLGVSIAVGTLAWLAVIGCFAALAVRFLRGRFFDPGNPRLLDAAAWTMIGGALTTMLLETFGRNGVLAAAGLGDYYPESTAIASPFLAIWGAAVVLGLVSLAFRRGIRLQRDTEGLV